MKISKVLFLTAVGFFLAGSGYAAPAMDEKDKANHGVKGVIGSTNPFSGEGDFKKSNIKSGWQRNGKLLECRDSDNKVMRSISIVERDKEERRGKKLKISTKSFRHRISKDGAYLGLITEESSRDNAEEYGILVSTSRFQFIDQRGNILWSREQIGDLSISDDGKRVLLIHIEPLTPEQQQYVDAGLNRSWLVVYNENGKEVFKYDPGPGKMVGSQMLSGNGKYGVVGNMCFAVESREIHALPKTAKGAIGIDNDGWCSVIKYLREHDADGKQKVDVVYEHQLK